ncbi:MAG: peptide ABC transporter substrate-binding protein [Candidatus Thorarchaeota archaeon]|nr:MAG: peptide ABC transporter substrate-binding protein [Candidatus Thorarchaeota archaeon]
MSQSETLVSLANLKKYFPLTGGVFRKIIGMVHAVDDVSLDIYRGETLGVVGESGCGKTTLGRTILRLLEPTDGTITFMGQDITHLKGSDLRNIRHEMQIVFQDPMASLDPRVTIKNTVGEPLLINGIARGPKLRAMVLDLLQKVGLTEDHLNRFPHEFSGGQRQRICIARALALNPKFVVMDEPTSSTDVSVQAQTLNLMKDLQDEFGLTYMFISHNLSVVKHMSDRLAVMYLGKIVELTPYDIFRKALHPYTFALVSAVPVPDPRFSGRAVLLKGEVPSPINPPIGCRFNPRCIFAQEICRTDEPPLRDVGDGHLVACHFAGELDFGKSSQMEYAQTAEAEAS